MKTLQVIFLCLSISLDLVVCVYSQALSAPLPTDNNSQTHLTNTQALQLARTFCQKIDQPVSGPGTASFPAPVDVTGDSYWLPRWQVTFANKAELQIADATGVITDYENDDYFSSTRMDRSPPGQAISQQEATKRAEDAVTATGQKEELQFWQAQLANWHSPPQADTYQWSIRWYRAFRGVQYRYQHASVSMDAQTGEIKGLTLMFPSPPVKASVLALSRDQAIGAGIDHLLNMGLLQPGGRFLGTQVVYVRPNGEWSHFQDQPGQSRSARLAWCCSFSSGGRVHDVWIDTETGEVLGGESGGPASAVKEQVTPTPTPPLTEALKALSHVYIRRSDPAEKSGWASDPALSLSDKEQPQFIAALATASQTAQAAPTEAAPYQLALLSKDNSLRVCSYYPDTGLLGNDANWFSVPPKFRAWMQKRIAAAPAPAKK